MNIQEMQNQANQILYQLGAKTVFVYVLPTSKTVASTVGAKVLNTTFLGFESPISGGIIYVNDQFLNKSFTDSEIQFIIAHECAHIYNNHAITSYVWNKIEEMLKGENNENYEVIEFIKFLFTLTSNSRLPPNAETLRNQEYEADRIAVNITIDLGSAISCLTKLVGGNMQAPSHTWELFDKAVPAMTMGERINTLRAGVEVI